MQGKISIEQFVQNSGYKESTIFKNRNKIPGLKYIDGEYIIIKGTRYPYNLGANKLKDAADRRYCLLDAISKFKYIDSDMLRLEQEQFEEILKELLDADLIKENHLGNKYGANAYDSTPKGDRVLENKRKEAKQEITKLISSAAGHFTGAVISEIYSIV